ncbi:MAG: ABC transporter permease [Deltaproteobacteria bacterium]|nr:ABC transporter permease [Deltaproteobacteria bacterium]
MSGAGLPMVLWAGRDVLRRPGVAVLFAVCLAALTVVTAVPLLLTQAVDDTVRTLLADSPSLVVRRVDAGGWRPLPAAEASERAAQVIGVTAARPRIWGVVAGPSGPVTVLAVPSTREPGGVPDGGQSAAPGAPGGALLRQWLGILSPGKAVVGPALAELEGVIELRGVTTLQLDVVGTMEPDTSMAVHDLVIVSPSDARQLLGLATGEASDLAVRVFHDTEEDAIVPDLVAAFPWPVHIRRKSETLDGYTTGVGRRGSLAMLTLTPALLGLVLLVVAAWRDGLANRREVGLLKALGWTTGDVLRLRLWRAAIVGLPAVVLGLVLGYQLVFWPGASWPGEVLLGWPQRPVLLTLRPGSAALILLEVSSLILLPWFAAALWPALRTATSQPERHLAEEQG